MSGFPSWNLWNPVQNTPGKCVSFIGITLISDMFKILTIFIFNSWSGEKQCLPRKSGRCRDGRQAVQVLLRKCIEYT